MDVFCFVFISSWFSVWGEISAWMIVVLLLKMAYLIGRCLMPLTMWWQMLTTMDCMHMMYSHLYTSYHRLYSNEWQHWKKGKEIERETYTHIYTEREREKKRNVKRMNYTQLSMCGFDRCYVLMALHWCSCYRV